MTGPGGTAALRRRTHGLLAPGTRGRALAGAAVGRVVVPLAGRRPPELRGGPGDAPVVLVVLLGATTDHVAQVVACLAEAQRVVGGFTPVFVVDGRAMAPVRRAGYVVEHVPAGGPARAEALAECRTTYATDVVLVLAAGALPDLALLAGLLRPRRRDVPAPPAVRRLMRRIERAFDRA